jgi:hypothetical protein
VASHLSFELVGWVGGFKRRVFGIAFKILIYNSYILVSRGNYLIIQRGRKAMKNKLQN